MSEPFGTAPPPGNVATLGLPADEYHRVEALSQSGARKLLRSPAHYLLGRREPAQPTPAMEFGTAVHTAVLEPDVFAARVAMLPEVDRRTKAGKQAFADFQAANPGMLLFDAEAFARIEACAAAVRAHPAAAKLLAGAEVELSLFWRDRQYDVPCKGRLDARNLGGIVDLKTTTDASKDAFARSAATFGYHTQGAHYFSGCEHALNATPEFFAIIAVESEPPHSVAVYALPSNAILAGAHLMNKALERYAQCLKTGAWPSYPDTIEALAFPRWAVTFSD